MLQYLYDETGRHIGVLEGMSKQANSTLIPPPFEEGIEFRFQGGEWKRPESDKRITRLAFIKRFTMEEWTTLESAAPTVPTIRWFLTLVNAARYIDLGREDVQAGVHLLAANGMLTQTRGTEILDTPITQVERIELVTL